jgi:hypothetical protein
VTRCKRVLEILGEILQRVLGENNKYFSESCNMLEGLEYPVDQSTNCT